MTKQCNLAVFFFVVAAYDCLQYMIEGSSMVKLRANSRQYHRYFRLLEDLSAIRWTPTTKKTSKAQREYLPQPLLLTLTFVFGQEVVHGGPLTLPVPLSSLLRASKVQREYL